MVVLPELLSAQERVLTLGIHFRQMLPATFLNIDPVENDKDFLNVTTEAPRGIGFGMPIRYGFTSLWSMETGLYFNRREYTQLVEDEELGISGETNFAVFGYEIPLMALANIQLEEKLFMNVGVGVSADMFASDVEAGYRDSLVSFNSISFRNNWIQMSVLGALGVEYRTEESGFFYLGGTFHRPFTYMLLNQVNYYRDPDSEGPVHFINTQLDGAYFSVDLRYFFPVSKDDQRKDERDKIRLYKPNLK